MWWSFTELIWKKGRLEQRVIEEYWNQSQSYTYVLDELNTTCNSWKDSQKRKLADWVVERRHLMGCEPRVSGRLRWSKAWSRGNSWGCWYDQAFRSWDRAIQSYAGKYLHHFIDGRQRNWVQLLNVAQFGHNTQTDSSIGRSQFEIDDNRYSVLLPLIDRLLYREQPSGL